MRSPATRSEERGSATVEFALVLPLVLVVALAVLQVGLVLTDQLVVVEAARGGAREAAVTLDDEAVRQAALRAGGRLDPERTEVEITRDGGAGDPVTVDVRYRAPVAVPGVRCSVSVLAATVCGFAVVLALLTLDVSRAIAGRSRAQSAADAAALAAADELALPTGRDPASLAASYAARNGARLVSCRCAEGSGEALVTVEVPIALSILGPDRAVRVSARAVVDEPAIFSSAAGGAGLQPWFARELVCLNRLVPGLVLESGFRTHAEQARLYREKPDLAAPPGHSLHERGLAADLAFPSAEAEARAHALAGSCGLAFPVSGEPWHTSPTGLE